MTEWDAATFEGAEAATERAVARATPEQRLRWLFEAQRFAAETGALQAELDRRAAEMQAQWDATASPRDVS